MSTAQKRGWHVHFGFDSISVALAIELCQTLNRHILVVQAKGDNGSTDDPIIRAISTAQSVQFRPILHSVRENHPRSISPETVFRVYGSSADSSMDSAIRYGAHQDCIFLIDSWREIGSTDLEAILCSAPSFSISFPSLYQEHSNFAHRDPIVYDLLTVLDEIFGRRRRGVSPLPVIVFGEKLPEHQQLKSCHLILAYPDIVVGPLRWVAAKGAVEVDCEECVDIHYHDSALEGLVALPKVVQNTRILDGPILQNENPSLEIHPSRFRFWYWPCERWDKFLRERRRLLVLAPHALASSLRGAIERQVEGSRWASMSLSEIERDFERSIAIYTTIQVAFLMNCFSGEIGSVCPGISERQNQHSLLHYAESCRIRARQLSSGHRFGTTKLASVASDFEVGLQRSAINYPTRFDLMTITVSEIELAKTRLFWLASAAPE